MQSDSGGCPSPTLLYREAVAAAACPSCPPVCVPQGGSYIHPSQGQRQHLRDSGWNRFPAASWWEQRAFLCQSVRTEFFTKSHTTASASAAGPKLYLWTGDQQVLRDLGYGCQVWGLSGCGPRCGSQPMLLSPGPIHSVCVGGGGGAR